MARTTPVNAGYTIINGAGTGSNGNRIDVWIEYAILGQNIANNTTEIIAQFYACLNPAYSSNTYGGNGCYSAFSVNGVTGWNLKSNGAFDFRSSSSPVHLGSYQGTITHNADGTKSISVSGSFTTSSSYITGGNVSGTITFATIPRATTPSVPSYVMGSAGYIDLSSRASAGFTHTLVYQFGTASGTIVSQTGATSVGWTPPVDLAAQIPSALSGTGTVTCHTYSGGTLIGTSYVNFTLSVPAYLVPSISALGVTKNNANSAIAAWGLFVKGYSTATLGVTAAGAYGSSIISYAFTVKQGASVIFGTTQTGNAWTTGLFPIAAADYTFSVTVTDSRGRTATYTSAAYTVHDYASPSLSLIDVFRCTSAGVIDLTNGTYISAKATFAFSSVNGNNAISKLIEYRQNGASSWITGQSNPANNTAHVFGAGTISTAYSYDIRFSVTDSVVGTVVYTLSIRPGLVSLHIRNGGKGVGIGGAADADQFQVYMPAVFKDSVNFTAGKDLKIGTNNIFHAGNDGAGSGLDADLLDGNHASAFATAAQGTLASNAVPKTSANRPGPIRIYRRDDDSGYNISPYWTGTYWYIMGYNGDTPHAGVQVHYANHTGNTLLWSGWWASGSITVADIGSWKLVEVQLGSTENRVLAIVNAAYLLGIGGNMGASTDIVGINASRSGTTLSLGGCGVITHTASGGHSAKTLYGVTAIYGLV